MFFILNPDIPSAVHPTPPQLPSSSAREPHLLQQGVPEAAYRGGFHTWGLHLGYTLQALGGPGCPPCLCRYTLLNGPPPSLSQVGWRQDGLHVLHVVLYPRYKYDMPILAMDLVVTPGGRVSLAIIDACPVTRDMTLPAHYMQVGESGGTWSWMSECVGTWSTCVGSPPRGEDFCRV